MANHDDHLKERDDLNLALDAALAKYASVEPREGLEERVMQNLRAADTQAAGQRVWWNWGVAAALAAVLMIAAVVWRWNKPTPSPVAIHPPALTQTPVGPDVAHRNENATPPRKSPQHRTRGSRPVHEVAALPKLDVFPTPLPLSEQERILASYVAHYPEHAALVAEARMDSLRQEAEERRRIASERDERQ